VTRSVLVAHYALVFRSSLSVTNIFELFSGKLLIETVLTIISNDGPTSVCVCDYVFNV